MYKTQISKELSDVKSRLSSFGITKEELITIAKKAMTARNDAISIDPINASGQLGYIYGTRAIREALLPKGNWHIDRSSNIEATFNPELNIKIIYQNVDCASSIMPPKAISGKGNAVKQLVDSNTAYLLPEMEEEFQAQLNSSIWFFLCINERG